MLLATGRRIQIFVRSREILHIFGILMQPSTINEIYPSEQKIKLCLEEADISSCTPAEVEKLVGNNSQEQKEHIMEEFHNRFDKRRLVLKLY